MEGCAKMSHEGLLGGKISFMCAHEGLLGGKISFMCAHEGLLGAKISFMCAHVGLLAAKIGYLCAQVRQVGAVLGLTSYFSGCGFRRVKRVGRRGRILEVVWDWIRVVLGIGRR